MNANDRQQTSSSASTTAGAQPGTESGTVLVSTAAVLEAVPTTWDDDRDERFFRLVHDAFSPAFLLGGTVLLASYDVD
jgi:hypothetical protein